MKRALSIPWEVNQAEDKSITPTVNSIDHKCGHACQFCGEIYPSRNKLFIHLRNRHVDNADSSANINQQQSATREDTSDIAMTVPISEELQFLYNDELCCVLRKPQGMATMGVGAGAIAVHNHPLLRILEHDVPHCGYRKAKPCHRLDALTGGILLCAKTLASELVLRKAFRERHVVKHYLAIVSGRLSQKSGLITLPLSNQASITKFTVLQETPSGDYGNGCVSTLLLYPITGRKHQLRRHLQLLGHPIIGDRRYTSALSWCKEFPQLFLWSVMIKVPHPRYYLKLQNHNSTDEYSNTNNGNYTNNSNTNDTNIDNIPADNSNTNNDENNNQSDDEDDNVELGGTIEPSGANIVNDEGFVSKAEQFLATISDANDILHVKLSEPAYYEAFRRRQKELFEMKQSQKQHIKF